MGSVTNWTQPNCHRKMLPARVASVGWNGNSQKEGPSAMVNVVISRREGNLVEQLTLWLDVAEARDLVARLNSKTAAAQEYLDKTAAWRADERAL